MRPLPRHIPVLAPCFLAAVFAAALAATALPVKSEDGLEPIIGKALFERIWVPAPSSTKANDGLGPLFNARSCAQCHHAATAGTIALGAPGSLPERGAVVRLADAQGRPDPRYGAQIQTRGIQQFSAEAEVHLSWETSAVTLPDGTAVELRKPKLRLNRPSLGAIEEATHASLSVAPPLDVAAAIAKVDLQALDGKGGSGRVERDADGRAVVFGRKASDRDIFTAAALAFSRDLGMSTALFPAPSGDCTSAQTACLSAPNGAEPDGVEIGEEILQALAAYVEALPQPSAPDERETQGRAAFEAAGCAACHVPKQKGREQQPVTLYSDLRLHDLGEDLAGTAEPNGTGPQEWRTAPLLGFRARLAAGATLLHDGRARSIEEAILWHGGEAQEARDRYAGLSRGRRAAIMRFLMGK